MAENGKRGKHGCLWAAIVLMLLVAGCGVLIVIGLFAAKRSGEHAAWHHGRGADEYPELKEIWAEGTGTLKVVRIPLSGMIMLGGEDDFFGSKAGSAGLALRAIQRATQDPEVKAVIMDIDSGGGGITASDILYKALVDFKAAQPGRVVVALFNDVAASGAYYIALAADHIIAHPTTITGSIGVLVQSLNMKELALKIGVKDVTIKSGENKDILNPFNDMTAEQRRMMQGIVDELYGRFVSLVSENRELSEEKVKSFADGSIFTARQAIELGLVDEIGYWSDALASTAEMLDVGAVRVYRYEEEISLSSFFKSTYDRNPLSALLQPFTRTRMMYLWQM
jgi:protease-4